MIQAADANDVANLYSSGTLQKEKMLMRVSTRSMWAAALLVMIVLAGACTSEKPFLIVHYQLPSSSQALEGQKVSLAVDDIRTNKAFLSHHIFHR